MADIRWEDPPPPDPVRYHVPWIQKLTPLMEHPKRWAIIDTRNGPENARTFVNNLKAGTVKRPPGKWEFVFRTVDGEYRVYGRYLGPDDEDGG